MTNDNNPTETTTPNTDEQADGAQITPEAAASVNAGAVTTERSHYGLIGHLKLYFSEAEHWTGEELHEAIAYIEAEKAKI